MVVAIKRFDIFGRKITRNIQYPAAFNLRHFMDGYIDEQVMAHKKGDKNATASIKKHNEVYDLYGVVIHKGSTTNSGHYFAYCKSASNNNWYECNDSYVGSMSENSVLNREAYLLFYQKRLNVPEPDITMEDMSRVEEKKELNQQHDLIKQEIIREQKSVLNSEKTTALSSHEPKFSESKVPPKKQPKSVVAKNVNLKPWSSDSSSANESENENPVVKVKQHHLKESILNAQKPTNEEKITDQKTMQVKEKPKLQLTSTAQTSATSASNEPQQPPAQGNFSMFSPTQTSLRTDSMLYEQQNFQKSNESIGDLRQLAGK